MKISPINELMPEYRDIKPAALKEKEINLEKLSETGAGVSPVQEKTEPPLKKADKDEGLETIGRSSDGDIAEASKAGIESAGDGMVVKKSLIGYSESELERLYLQGKIDSNSYEREIERREEIRGEKDEAADEVVWNEKEDKKTNNEAAKKIEEDRENSLRETIQRDEKIEKAEVEINKQRIDDQRLEVTQTRAKEDENRANAVEGTGEARKQIITEEMENDREFIQRMNVLAGAERDSEIKSEALDQAAENGRLKIMEQVIGVDPATASNV